MLYPRAFAKKTPNKPAIIMANSGAQMTYRELEEQANQAAQLFRSLGLKAGDKIAFALENRIEIFPFVWGAQRAGLLYVAISSRLTADEALYILEDSGAKLVLMSDFMGEAVLVACRDAKVNLHQYKLGDATPGYTDWTMALSQHETTPVSDESQGSDMLYSSGTTGRPKGILPKLELGLAVDVETPMTTLANKFFGVNDETVYLCPAPLYHAAPLRWTMAIHWLGGTAVVMEKYDAETALRLIESYKVTHAQFVPTHFIRMLKLDEPVRAGYDVSSMKVAIHAAAPCPEPIKRAMIDWWGPIIYEYYAGSEGNGITLCDSRQWLDHPGTVGQPVMGAIHICDDKGEPLADGEEGMVYFEGESSFVYHNDTGKTQQAYNKHGWSTLGDVGRLDEDGFLYLVDRKNFMIISGGVNIYPQEIENHLITHPKVTDVAVIGAPDEDFGERVVAVVQPDSMSDVGDAFAQELTDYCRGVLSGIKIPRQIDFRETLPRADTGKLYKRLIRDEYWNKTERS